MLLPYTAQCQTCYSLQNHIFPLKTTLLLFDIFKRINTSIIHAKLKPLEAL